jgi:hypothetical protein
VFVRAGESGLRGIEERAKVVGGNLGARSKLDSGTEIELNSCLDCICEIDCSRWFSGSWLLIGKDPRRQMIRESRERNQRYLADPERGRFRSLYACSI